MGQYFKPINLTTGQYMNPHTFDNGIKQMEHSWIGNNFVHEVYARLLNEWAEHCIVWAGDYADDELMEGYEHYYPANYEYSRTLYGLCMQNEDYETAFTEVVNSVESMEPKFFVEAFPYLINETKKEFVNLLKVPDNHGWRVHPLPILTSTTEGAGGGDYRGLNIYYRGRWKGDRLRVSNEEPDYVELRPNFKEQ